MAIQMATNELINAPPPYASHDVRKIAEVIFFIGRHLSFPHLNRRRVDVEAAEPVDFSLVVWGN
jgi:hypothetical protein